MSLGTLTIRMPDGQTQQFEVERSALAVGRGQDNELFIEDGSLSRRHARLTFEDGRMLVEDLGSTSGSYIGGQRLAANTPSLAPEGQPIRLGDVEVEYAPSPEALRAASEAAARASNALAVPVEAPLSSPVEATLEGPARPVAPGSSTTATLTLQNRGSSEDEFLVRVSDIPADWVRLSHDRVTLRPGALEPVMLTFLPPRRPEAAARVHPFTLSVTSRQHTAQVNVPGVLQVLPFEGLALNLQPVRSAGIFQLSAQNEGNASAVYTLAGEDDAHALLYEFDQPTLTLEPGQAGVVGLRVSPKAAPRIGAREVRPFEVVARPVGLPGAAGGRATGQLILRPPIPIWLIPATILLSLSLCVAGAYAYVRACPAYGTNLPFCPAAARPVINVFTVTPIEVGRGGTVVIAWDVSNAQAVQLVAPVEAVLPASGVKAFQVGQSTTFTLRASNFAGSVDKSVSVMIQGVAPVIQSFAADPGVITPGQSGRIVLRWSVIGARSVRIKGVPGQAFPPAGSVEVAAPTANTTYTLVASGEAGTASQEVTVVVTTVQCTLTQIPAGEVLGLRVGPGGAYPNELTMGNGTRVDPIGRNTTGDWLAVRALGRTGWVPANFVACGAVSALPTVDPALIPTLAPTATPTPAPPTFTPLPTRTPTPAPV